MCHCGQIFLPCYIHVARFLILGLLFPPERSCIVHTGNLPAISLLSWNDGLVTREMPIHCKQGEQCRKVQEAMSR